MSQSECWARLLQTVHRALLPVGGSVTSGHVTLLKAKTLTAIMRRLDSAVFDRLVSGAFKSCLFMSPCRTLLLCSLIAMLSGESVRKQCDHTQPSCIQDVLLSKDVQCQELCSCLKFILNGGLLLTESCALEDVATSTSNFEQGIGAVLL